MPSGLTTAQLVGLATANQDTFSTKKLIQTFKTANYPLFEFIQSIAEPKAGVSLSFNVAYKEDPARPSLPYQPDDIAQNDYVVRFRPEWGGFNRGWMMDIDEEVMNSGPDAIYDEMKQRRIDAYKAMVELAEDQMVTPLANSTDLNRLVGIPAQIFPGPTGAYAAGFKGGEASTILYSAATAASTIFGVDLSSTDPDYERLRNYAFLHSRVVDQVFMSSLFQAMAYTNFTPPSIIPTDGPGAKPGLGLFPTSMWVSWAAFVQKTGSNWGNKGGTTADMSMLQIIHSQKLQKTSATDTHVIRSMEPCYFLPKDAVKFHPLRGRWMVESKPRISGWSHNVSEAFLDARGQFIVRDRRRCICAHAQRS